MFNVKEKIQHIIDYTGLFYDINYLSIHSVYNEMYNIYKKSDKLGIKNRTNNKTDYFKKEIEKRIVKPIIKTRLNKNILKDDINSFLELSPCTIHHNIVLAINPARSGTRFVKELIGIKNNTGISRIPSKDNQHSFTLYHELAHTLLPLIQSNKSNIAECFSDSFAILSTVFHGKTGTIESCIEDMKTISEARSIGLFYEALGDNQNRYLTGLVCNKTIEHIENLVKENKVLTGYDLLKTAFSLAQHYSISEEEIQKLKKEMIYYNIYESMKTKDIEENISNINQMKLNLENDLLMEYFENSKKSINKGLIEQNFNIDLYRKDLKESMKFCEENKFPVEILLEKEEEYANSLQTIKYIQSIIESYSMYEKDYYNEFDFEDSSINIKSKPTELKKGLDLKKFVKDLIEANNINSKSNEISLNSNIVLYEIHYKIMMVYNMSGIEDVLDKESLEWIRDGNSLFSHSPDDILEYPKGLYLENPNKHWLTDKPIIEKEKSYWLNGLEIPSDEPNKILKIDKFEI